MKRPIEINVNWSAVIVGVLALVLLMHVIIGLRFASFDRRLQTYNEYIAGQVVTNENVNQALRQHLVLVEGFKPGDDTNVYLLLKLERKK